MSEQERDKSVGETVSVDSIVQAFFELKHMPALLKILNNKEYSESQAAAVFEHYLDQLTADCPIAPPTLSDATRNQIGDAAMATGRYSIAVVCYTRDVRDARFCAELERLKETKQYDGALCLLEALKGEGVKELVAPKGKAQ